MPPIPKISDRLTRWESQRVWTGFRLVILSCLTLKKKGQKNRGLSGCLAAFRSDRSSLGTQPCLSSSSLTDTHADKNRQIHPGTRVSCFRTRMTSLPPPPTPPSPSPSLLYSLLAAKIPAMFNMCGFTDCLTALLLAGSVQKNVRLWTAKLEETNMKKDAAKRIIFPQISQLHVALASVSSPLTC